jgi:predicted HicB family RNase H-like nuclease
MAVSKAQQRAVAKYMANNYDEIKLRVPKGQKAQMQAFAKKQGKSLNAFIVELIHNEMNK